MIVTAKATHRISTILWTPTTEWLNIMGFSILVVVVAILIYRWWGQRDIYSTAAEWWRVATLDVDDDEDTTPLPQAGRLRVVRAAVSHARTELGLLGDTAANRMVVSSIVRKFMKEHGMRPSHISSQFQLAVDMYFLRSTGDEELRLIRNSRGYQKYRRTTNNV